MVHTDTISELTAPEYLTWGEGFPLRQAVLFPRPALLGKVPTRNAVSATIALELANGTIWSLRLPCSRLQDPTLQLLRVAEILGNEPMEPSGWESLQSRLRYLLECPVAIINPSFKPGDLGLWQIRSVALHLWALSAGNRSTAIGTFGEWVSLFEASAAVSLARVLVQFVSRLDSEVFMTAKVGAIFHVAWYNYLIGVSAMTRRNRLQLAKVFPLFVPLLSEGEPSSIKSVKTLRQVVDEGQPFIGCTADIFRVSRATVRFLTKKETALIGDYWTRRVPTLLRVLSVIRPEKRPQDSDTWRNFTKMYETITHLLRRPGITPVSLTWLSAMAQNGFREIPEFVRSAEFAENWLAVVDEFLAALELALSWEMARHAPDNIVDSGLIRDVIERCVIAHTPKRLHEIAKRWRAAYLRTRDRATEKRGVRSLSWTPILTEPHVIDGMTITEPQSAEELVEEGHRMLNCVASYTPNCLSGHTHIFSIRDTSQSPLSMAEIRLVRRRTREVSLDVIQHKGTGNSRPPIKCSAALGNLFKTLSREPYTSRLWALYLAREHSARHAGGRADADKILGTVETLRATLTGKWAYDGLVTSLQRPPSKAV